MSTVMDKGMEVSPEAKNGPESEVSGLPKGPIKDNNLNSPLQVGARKKLFTHESKSARKIQPPSTDNVMLVCHSAIDDDPAKSAALAVEKINTLSHNIGIEKVALVASHKTGGKHTGMVSARVSKLLSQEEADKITKDFHLIHVGHADITHFQAFALDYENNIAKVVCYLAAAFKWFYARLDEARKQTTSLTIKYEPNGDQWKFGRERDAAYMIQTQVLGFRAQGWEVSELTGWIDKAIQMGDGGPLDAPIELYMTEGGIAFKPGFLDTITGGEYSKKATRMKSLGFDREGNERPKQAANLTWKFESADVLDRRVGAACARDRE